MFMRTFSALYCIFIVTTLISDTNTSTSKTIRNAENASINSKRKQALTLLFIVE